MKYINLNYYCVKVEAFNRTPVRFNNKELSSTNGSHPITADTAKNFELAINYFGGNYYKTQSWDEFYKVFKGQIK